VSVATLTAVAFYLEVHSTTAALLYLIVIVLMALRTGAAPSAVTAMLAYLGLDSFFTAPLFRPAMNQPLDVVAPIVFLTTAFTINRLAAKNRQSFQEIQSLQDQLRLVMDTIPGLVWSELPNGSVEFLNQRWRDFLGASSTPVTDLRRNLPVHPAEADSLAEQWQQARMRGQAFETEVRVRRADGVYRRLRLHVVPAGEPGQVVKWYGLGTDIEDWRQAEESLAKLQSELVSCPADTAGGAGGLDCP
jgi:PAS domain S-box